MNRTWMFETLKTVGDFNDNVIQGEALTKAKVPPPFAVYRMGNDTNEALWDDYEDNPDVGRQFFQVYIHDRPADYARIDDLVEEVKLAFRTAELPPGVISIRYLETSRDLDDATLQTIFRYVRFQLIRAG